jgi:TPR repeat protein
MLIDLLEILKAKRLCNFCVAKVTVAVLLLVSGIFAGALVSAASEQDSAQTYEDGIAAAQRGQYGVATKILLPLAEEGDSAAQLALGQIYYSRVSQGKSDRPSDDIREAEKWFRLAAEKGIALAQFGLGVIYNNRWATNQTETAQAEEEYTEAVSWHRLAAEQELAPAQMALANLLMMDKSTRSQGFQWYLRAANQGYVEAYGYVSGSYERGRGVEKNLGEALRWARLAADAGHAGGYWQLARMYEKGVAVTQDNVQAYMWYDLVAQTENDKSAAIYRDIVASRMTQEQITEAQRLAREWMAIHRQ